MDKAAQATDQRLKKIEKKLKEVYEQGTKDVTKEWKKYMTTQDAYVKDLQEAYAAAKQFSTAEEARELGRQLGVAKAERTLQNSYYKEMVKTTTRKMSELNQTALAYVNDEMPWVYATNFNAAAKTAEKVGFRFDLVDEGTIKKRVMAGDITLPKKKIDVPKDMRWNTKKLNAAVLQGIVNGEPINKISDRIMPIVGNNLSAAVRTARTMVTGAQNEGRLDSYEYMKDNGVILNKVWMATHDERTRESHAELDGEEVGIDEPFSNGLMYPGDPSGDPEEVYNCRCTMVTHVVGFEKADGRIESVDIAGYEPDYDFPQLEAEEKKPSFTIAQGKDISITWERRPDEFDFEIEDVINAQGFDGNPRVVSPEEFDRYVQEGGIYCQRIYGAEEEEIVKEYQKMLYEGKWYVDCSNGGAAYGQGMYCGTGMGKLHETKDLAGVMNNYADAKYNIIETFTLDKNAKTISNSALGDKWLKLTTEDMAKYGNDRGVYAAALGYDAITQCGRKEYAVILNRTACVFKEGTKIQSFEEIHNHWMDWGK